MLTKAAKIYGILFLIIGILGFFRTLTPDGNLFGTFKVNLEHNVFHLGTGILAILAGYSGARTAKKFFLFFGILYAAVALLGFIRGEGLIIGMIAINRPDNWLHAAIAFVSLMLGIGLKDQKDA